MNPSVTEPQAPALSRLLELLESLRKEGGAPGVSIEQAIHLARTAIEERRQSELRRSILEETIARGVQDAEEKIVELASRAGARFVFTGGYTRPNWKLELSIELWQVDVANKRATRVGEANKRGDFSDCFAIIDDLLADLLAKAGKPVPPDDEAEVKRAPTGDFYAFTLYGRGLTALHGMGGSVELARAEKDLGRAVFIDPKFADWFDPTALARYSASSAFKGSGATTRTGALSAVITARVAEVLPNGDLVLEGVREIDINGDRQIIVLTGVVRPADINPGNVVPSTAVGHMRIRYFGRGLIKDNLSPGWLLRIINKIF